jgi:energy-coupling factor transporter ATP-binding protein EcfA2
MSMNFQTIDALRAQRELQEMLQEVLVEVLNVSEPQPKVPDMNSNDFANKAMQLLKDNGTRSSQWLLRQLEIPVQNHDWARAILKRLAYNGLLSKTGSKAYYWTLQQRDWSQSNPFRGPEGYQPINSSANEFKPYKPQWTPPSPVNVPNAVDTSESKYDDGSAYDKIINKKRIDQLQEMEKESNELIGKLTKRIGTLEDMVDRLESTRKVEIKIIKPDLTEVLITKRVHPMFEEVLFHLEAGDNVMLVGPSGCGKTYLSEDIANALNVPYGLQCYSGGVSEFKLFGRSTPNITTGAQEYHPSQFIDLLDKPAVFMHDEIDAGDPNMTISLNAVLTTGKVSVDRKKNPVVVRHDRNMQMSAANTMGTGADRKFVGRNQLDAAFLTRWTLLEMDYDKALELALCPGAEEMVETMHRYREKVVANRLEREITTRFICKAYKWMERGKDMDFVNKRLFTGWREDEITRVKSYY